MKIRCLRNATLLLEIGSVRFLVDPMLSSKGVMDPVKISRNADRIPLIDLPVSDEELKHMISNVDAVIVTHTHRDHWDVRAQELLPKSLPLLCQPSDVETFEKQNFEQIIPVNTSIEFKNLKFHRTGGQHGTGDVGLRMGHVSGFVIETSKEKLYIAGDTIWCTEVESAIQTHKPDYVVVNAGAAQFDQGGPITMNAEDVLSVLNASPRSKVVAVHMEAVNHCQLTRTQLTSFLKEKTISKNWKVPSDGDTIDLRA